MSKGTVSPAQFAQMMAEGKFTVPGAASSSSAAPSNAGSKPLSLSLNKPATSAPVPASSAAEKQLIQKAASDLQKVQETTNAWFSKLELLNQSFALSSVNESLSQATNMCEQLTSVAKEASWLEQEVAKVEAENTELEEQIRMLQTSIDDTRSLLKETVAAEQKYRSNPITNTVMLLVTFIAVILVFVLLGDSFLKGRLAYNPWN